MNAGRSRRSLIQRGIPANGISSDRTSQIPAVTRNITASGAATISAAIIRTLPTVAPTPPSRTPLVLLPTAVAITQMISPAKNVNTIGTASRRTRRWRHMRSITGT